MCTSCGCDTICIIKQGDLEPPIMLELLSGKVPADLSTALSVTMTLSKDGQITHRLGMDTEDQIATPGLVSYVWSPGETDVPGRYRAEVVVMWPGNRRQTFPDDGYFVVKVVEALL
jgi:hypothetical protein